MARLLIFCLSLLLTNLSHSSDWYAGVDAHYFMLDVAGTEFEPLGMGGRLGYYLQPKVGLELHVLSGISEGDELDIETEVNYAAGFYGRFESPKSDDGMSIYFLLGYAYSELDMDRSGTGQPGDETFDGFSYGGGFEFPLGSGEKYSLTLQMLRYYSDDDVDLDSASLGVKVGF